jgi:hypothetical protein
MTNLPLNQIDKNYVFQYVVDELLDWYGLEKDINNNDFSVLKTLKLLFFVTAASTELGKDSLLVGVFDKFYAMPYGHVESSIYDSIKNGQFINSRYNITKSKTIINQNIQLPVLDKNIQIRVRNSVSILKHLNYNIVFMNQFELVDLSHKWDSWKLNFSNSSTPISPSKILDESKIYS